MGSLCGEHDYPQIFPADWKPATATAKELLDGAVWRRCALQSSSSSDYSMDSKEEDLHAATMEEVGLGHLQGPFTMRGLGRMLGFSQKIRPHTGYPREPKGSGDW